MDIKGYDLIKKVRLYNNQFNLYIIDYCNKNCKYCYEKSNFKKNKKIDLITLKKIFNFLNTLSKKGLISIIGGEPFLYPNIKTILDSKFNKSKHDIHIYTNGSIDLTSYLTFLKDKYITFTLHYNIKQDFPIFKKNIILAKKNNLKYQVNILFFNCDDQNYINQIQEITQITSDYIFTPVHDFFDSKNFQKYFDKFLNNLKKFNLYDNFIKYYNLRFKKEKNCKYNEIHIINRDKIYFEFNSCYLKDESKLIEFHPKNYPIIKKLLNRTEIKCSDICPNDFAFYGSCHDINNFNFNT